MADNTEIKISKEELEELIQEKVQEELNKSKKSVEALNNPESISRREFLKKAGLGFGGLVALASPVSADYFIKDDSFSVQTSNDGGSTLTEGLYVDQNQNVNIPNGVLNIQGSQVATQNWANSNLVSSVNGQTGDVTITGSISLSGLNSISSGIHTNNTGHVIMVYAYSDKVSTVNGGVGISGFIDGTKVVENVARGYAGAYDADSGPVGISFMVPDGSNYSIEGNVDSAHYQEIR